MFHSTTLTASRSTIASWRGVSGTDSALLTANALRSQALKSRTQPSWEHCNGGMRRPGELRWPRKKPRPGKPRRPGLRALPVSVEQEGEHAHGIGLPVHAQVGRLEGGRIEVPHRGV